MATRSAPPSFVSRLHRARMKESGGSGRVVPTPMQLEGFTNLRFLCQSLATWHATLFPEIRCRPPPVVRSSAASDWLLSGHLIPQEL
ncbi:hypothetical protein COCON_G00147790 [Conger conger]|uniref:Uncharacterized protein n=1 Tax=Conger conger TaxID=82655 RepID=A0A9Q1DCK6_CONCO|nr:hypothetical protein COCON_G00147790 [Conger conger]